MYFKNGIGELYLDFVSVLQLWHNTIISTKQHVYLRHRKADLWLVKLSRAHDLLSRAHEFISRVHEFISRGHKFISRAYLVRTSSYLVRTTYYLVRTR